MQRILFQGDSITDAGRSRDSEVNPGCGYPGHLRGILGLERPGEFECLNRGVSGNRIVDLYARVKIDFINLKPDVISILIGINDVWHELSNNNGVSAPKFELVYDLLLSELTAELPGARLIILEPFVLSGEVTVGDDKNPGRLEYYMSETHKRALAARRVAQKYKAAFVPLQEAFNAACRSAPPEWWLRDGVHPTSAGHQLIARKWLEAAGI